MLTLQPPTPVTNHRRRAADEHPIPSKKANDRKLPPLVCPIQNFFAAGSPLGVILLLRGFKIASRKSLTGGSGHDALSDVKSPSPTSINFCYPAVENLYNIFHKVMYLRIRQFTNFDLITYPLSLSFRLIQLLIDWNH